MIYISKAVGLPWRTTKSACDEYKREMQFKQAMSIIAREKEIYHGRLGLN